MSHWENKGITDEWYTPRYIFDALGCFFTMDVCAPMGGEYVKTPTEWFITHDSLEFEWRGFVWMNPPFGGRNGLIPWLNKIADHGNGIALTPDRTSAPWWQDAAKRSDAHLQISGKVKFIDANGNEGKSPSNGTTLFAYGDQALKALINAQNNGLGQLFIKYKD